MATLPTVKVELIDGAKWSEEARKLIVRILGDGVDQSVPLPILATIEERARTTEDRAVEILDGADELLKATLFHLLKVEGWTEQKAHAVRRKAGVSK